MSITQQEAPAVASEEQTYDVLTEFVKRLLCDADVAAIENLLNTEITFSHFRTLMILFRRGRAQSVNELSEALHLSLAATGRNVDRLVGLGLVDRREDAHDRRVKRVTLTDEGHTMVNSHLDSKEDQFREFVRRLPIEHRDNLHSALKEIVTGDYLLEPDPVFSDRNRQKVNG